MTSAQPRGQTTQEGTEPIKATDMVLDPLHLCLDTHGMRDGSWPLSVSQLLQVETPGPQYNLFVVLFGASVHDANSVPPQDYTIAYTCAFV